MISDYFDDETSLSYFDDMFENQPYPKLKDPYVTRKLGVASRIVLSGTHGTGKTTMFKYLKHELRKADYHRRGLHYAFREEPIRIIKDYGFPINQEAGDASQLAMASYHMASLGYPDFLSDRCIVDVYVYARYLHEHIPGLISVPCMNMLETLVFQFIATFKGVVFCFACDEQEAIQDDGLRDLDKGFRNGINSLMFNIWCELQKCTHINRIEVVHWMPDSFAERLKLIKRVLWGQEE